MYRCKSDYVPLWIGLCTVVYRAMYRCESGYVPLWIGLKTYYYYFVGKLEITLRLRVRGVVRRGGRNLWISGGFQALLGAKPPLENKLSPPPREIPNYAPKSKDKKFLKNRAPSAIFRAKKHKLGKEYSSNKYIRIKLE